MRKTPLRRTTPLHSTGRPRAKKRSPSEFSRVYGSKRRVEWIQGLRCLVAGKERICCGPSENAHIENGGMSRKADAELIVPLCASHHGLLHRQGVRWFQSHYGVDLKQAAAKTQTMWEAQA